VAAATGVPAAAASSDMTAGSSLIALAIAVVLTVAAAVMAGMDTAVRLLQRGRVHRLVEAKAPGSGFLEVLADRSSRTLTAAAFALALAYVSGALAGTLVMLDRTGLPAWAAAAIGGALALILVFVLADALPRAVAVHNPEGAALALARPATWIVPVAYPPARALSAIWTGLLRVARGETGPRVPWMTEDEYRAHAMAEDEDAATDAETEDAIIGAVTAFGDKIVRELMVPRTDMHCLEDTATLADALALIEESGVSRLPVYHETVDDVLGILYAKDLLLALGKQAEKASTPAALARPATFVPETKPVDELLVEMRSQPHIAIVADEYGGTSGLVTLEDLIEEIVGEIQDEYDREEPMIVDLGGGCFRIDARVPIDDLNETFGTAIELEADSVGGLFTEIAGHIPQVGESVDIEGLRLTVERLEGARIREITVRPASGCGEEEDIGEQDHAG
jgi:putative hemolysin